MCIHLQDPTQHNRAELLVDNVQIEVEHKPRSMNLTYPHKALQEPFYQILS